ncbi:hypothetical protein FQA39_LY03635 [Lamprigera yunnana]|nr:hypothetical protein FQA39_LY03635 [Lamprigera yunnana]
MNIKTYTLVFVKKTNKILLGLKTRGFGAGLWNGFGGKVEQDELVIDGAARELKEESNLDVDNLTQLGIVTYEEEHSAKRSIVHIFVTYSPKGTEKPSEEMNPIRWYPFEEIPYQKMQLDANMWYPYVLQDETFLAYIMYGQDETVKKQNIFKCNIFYDMSTTYYTLVFITLNNHVLLGYKKRGFGIRKWNGYGGKIETDENAIDGAVRELFEESNLVVEKEDLKCVGLITYNEERHTRVVYIFTSSQFRGELKETEEMKPKWFHFANLPYKSMWPDSILWLPLLLNKYYLQANFTYNNCILAHSNVQQFATLPNNLKKIM